MSEALSLTVTLQPATDPEFAALVERCHTEDPDPKDLRALRRALAKAPALYRSVFDFSELVEDTIIENMITWPAAQAGIEAHARQLRTDLGYDQAPGLERILIDSVVLSWLNYQWAEFRHARGAGGAHSMTEGAYWASALDGAHRRYLRACETLAKVRKMARNTPALQVNIATQSGQQVNIAGDFVKNEPPGSS